jgi:glyoxylase-like metal-dependent hydrolase (beta-lactamase superfamily II)
VKATTGIHSVETILYEKVLTRSHVICGERVALIDTGTSVTYGQLAEVLRELGLGMEDVALVLHTHGHGDHIGSDLQVSKASRCLIGAHRLAASWIEDHELQFQEVMNPYPEALPASKETHDWYMAMMDGDTRVDLKFEEGLAIDLGEGVALEVLHLPGHTPGDVGFYWRAGRTMIIGDAAPFLEDLSVALYYDPAVMLTTVRRLAALRKELPFATLLSGHYAPMREGEIDLYLDGCVAYVSTFERTVLDRVKASSAGATLGEVSQTTADCLRKSYDAVALVTSLGHLKALEAQRSLRRVGDRWMNA